MWGDAFVSLVIVATVLGAAGVVYVTYQMIKWGYPFQSLDWLDLVFRVKHEFAVCLKREDFDKPARGPCDISVGEVYDVICRRLQMTGVSGTFGSWNRFRRVVAESLNVSPLKIRRNSRLYGDLEMTSL